MKTRRYIIQKATGLLDDEPLEEKLPIPHSGESEEEEELTEQTCRVARSDLIHKVSKHHTNLL